MNMGERHERRIIIGEPHAHMRESMESIFDFSSTLALARLLLRLVLLFVCSSILALSRRLVLRFTSLYVRHLQPRIIVLIRNAFVIPSGSRKTTASPWENFMGI